MLYIFILLLFKIVICSNKMNYNEITKDNMKNSYNFIIHGDWGWNSINQSLTAYEMGIFGDIIENKFVVALGDNFYGDGVTDTHDELWDSAFHDIFIAPSLTKVKWYGVLGNHDYHGNIIAQVDRTVTSGESMWYMENTYYYKDYEVYGGAILTIVYIDTCLLDPYAKDTESILSNPNWVEERMDHLDWIDETLAAATTRANWIIVAGHYPIYSIGEHGDDQFLIDDLLPILLQYKVHAYLAGHDHSHQHIYKDGLHHIISGNTAGRGPFGEKGYQYLGVSAASANVLNWFLNCGFGVVSVTDKKLDFTFIDNGGNIHYQTSLTNVINPELITGVYLRGLGVSPRFAGVIILLPTLSVAIFIVLFLSKEYWMKSDLSDQESTQKPSPSTSSSTSTKLTPNINSKWSNQQNDDYLDESGRWSSLDVSTDRLAPSRHGG